MSDGDRRTVNVWDSVAGHSVNVDGHPMASREKVPAEELGELPEDRLRHEYGDPEDLTPGDELPVLLRRDFRAGPIEGEQGSFTQIVERDCPRCGYDRANHSAHTLAGVHTVACRACGHIIEQA